VSKLPITIPASRPGRLDIQNLQGNTKTIALDFKRKDINGAIQPLDLRTYQELKIAIREVENTQTKPFAVFTVGNGLNILGDNYNTLSFTLGESFWTKQVDTFYYDLLVKEQDGLLKTLVRGKILIDFTITRDTD
jgi:hypothetical protein